MTRAQAQKKAELLNLIETKKEAAKKAFQDALDAYCQLDEYGEVSKTFIEFMANRDYGINEVIGELFYKYGGTSIFKHLDPSNVTAIMDEYLNEEIEAANDKTNDAKGIFIEFTSLAEQIKIEAFVQELKENPYQLRLIA